MNTDTEAITEKNPSSSGRFAPSGFVLLAVALTGAFAWSYWSTIASLLGTWIREPDYSHGFLVAPAALYCLWLRRDRYPTGARRPQWAGLVLIVASIAMRALSALWFMDALEGWSILVWISGLVLLLGGWRVLAWSLPAILLLFFMVPLPYHMEHWVRAPMQGAATQTSVALLQCLGQPALAEGHTILIGTEHLGVEDACSGLRIMMSIGALTLACASVVRRPLWERLILVLSAVPIAVLANSCRIVVTGLLYQYASGEAARVFSHDLAGWLMIPLAGGLLVAEMWCLRRVMTESGPSDVKELVERERDEIAAVFQPRGLRQGESRK